MKKFNLSYVFMLFASLILLTSSHPKPTLKNNVNNNLKEAEKLEKISVERFLSLSMKEFNELSGGKTSIKEKLFFISFQKKLKKEVKKNIISPQQNLNFKSSLAAFESGFRLGSFLVGFFFGFIGVLIVYLTTDDPDSRKSSLYGVAGFFAFWMILYFAILASI